MYEYRFVSTRHLDGGDQKFDKEVNDLAKEGWEVDKISTCSNMSFSILSVCMSRKVKLTYEPK